MSCYNWESGEIKFSVAEYRRFKKAFREGYSKLQDHEKAAATRHWEKYKSGKLPREAHNPTFHNEKHRFWRIWSKWVKSNTDPNNPNVGSWQPRNRPRKPTRADYPLANSKTCRFTFADEGEIRFSVASPMVFYSSGENNHQVELARGTEVVKLFFQLLANVKWTRGTGGQLTGNDEYNREGTEEGRGGNYVTLRCGPKEPEVTPSGHNRMRGTIVR